MKSLKLTILSLSGAMLFAAPAFAGDSQCIWDHLSAAQRDAAIENGLAGLPKNLHDIVSDSDAQTAAKACGYTPKPIDDNAVLGMSNQRAAEIWFSRTLSIAPEKLDAAWVHLGDETRAKLKADMLSPNTDTALVEGAVMAILTDLGLSPEDKRAKAADMASYAASYVGGRAVREAVEPQL